MEYTLANNPFTDDEIEVKRKEFCGKCYKLDRTKMLCERYDKPLNVALPGFSGFSATFEKCDECKAFSRGR